MAPLSLVEASKGFLVLARGSNASEQARPDLLMALLGLFKASNNFTGLIKFLQPLQQFFLALVVP